jgi:hypothetical protein
VTPMLSVLSTKMGLFISCISSKVDVTKLRDGEFEMDFVVSPNVTPSTIISIGVVRTRRYFTSLMKTLGFGLISPTLTIK